MLSVVSLPQQCCSTPKLASIPFQGTIFATTPPPPPGFNWRPCAGESLSLSEQEERKWKLRSAAISPSAEPSTAKVPPPDEHHRSWTGDPLPPAQELEIQLNARTEVAEAIASTLITSIPDSPPQDQPSILPVHLSTPITISTEKDPITSSEQNPAITHQHQGSTTSSGLYIQRDWQTCNSLLCPFDSLQDKSWGEDGMDESSAW